MYWLLTSTPHTPCTSYLTWGALIINVHTTLTTPPIWPEVYWLTTFAQHTLDTSHLTSGVLVINVHTTLTTPPIWPEVYWTSTFIQHTLHVHLHLTRGVLGCTHPTHRLHMCAPDINTFDADHCHLTLGKAAQCIRINHSFNITTAKTLQSITELKLCYPVSIQT